MIKKMVMFAMTIASRGLAGKKIDLPTKQLRYLSCYGNGEIKPCKNLKKSDHSNFYYCNGCGCGDHPHTWLIKNKGEYSKLDYPKLNCPITMPGFTNYAPSKPDESISPITRKYFIENIDFEDLNKMPVTLPEMPDAMKKAMEDRERAAQQTKPKE